MARDFSRLFRPHSIAVFGGGAWGSNVVRQCRLMGFEGPVWPVHPARDEIEGLPCYRLVEDLPAAPDAAFIAVNRHLTIDIVERLAARGAGGAVCFASGFAEAEGPEGEGSALQARLVAAAGEMPILGPNCYGLLNYLDGSALWPDEHGGRPVERGVAVITQSSNMLINVTMQRRGLPLAYCVAAGNQAQTGIAEMATALLEDPRVTALGLHIEGIGDVRAFEAMAARARALGKPVIALKVGRSEAAQSAALTHTASLTGSDAGGRALLARLGIPSLSALPEFLDALMLLHTHGGLPGTRFGSLSCSGGEASLIADMAAARGVPFEPLGPADVARLRATVKPLVTVANPIDYHTFDWGDRTALTRTYTAFLETGFDLTFLIIDFPRADRCSDASWEPSVLALTDAAHATGARVAAVSTMAEGMPEPWAERFLAAGVAPLTGLGEALSAAVAAAEAEAARARPPAPPLLLAPSRPGAAVATLDERMAKHALATHGVPVPEGRIAATPAEAAAAAEALGGPVALKALGLAHKTEHGAVRLALVGGPAVQAAAQSMPAPDGFLVEAMVAGAVAELLVGVLRDPAHGFTLTLGAGGTLTEILADTVTLLIPSDRAAIRTALSELRIWPVLAGYRGQSAADIDAILDAVLAVQAFAETEAGRLAELDINPLIVTPLGAVAADALIRLDEPHAHRPERAPTDQEGETA